MLLLARYARSAAITNLKLLIFLNDQQKQQL